MWGSVLEKCVSCHRCQAPLCQQKMANLTERRILAEKPPITSVGEDFLGPFQVHHGQILVKRYGVIFTCLAICAMHLEIAHGSSIDSFLLTLWCFIAIRCQVKEIWESKSLRWEGGVWRYFRLESGKVTQFLVTKITSTGSSALRVVLTLEVFGRDASELFRRFYKPYEQITDDESLATLMWSWEYHEQPTHNYHVWWSKQQLTPWRPTTCCCSNRKSPYPPVYSRGKILCCIVDARKYNISGTSSGRDGARSTFPLCNLDKSRCTQRGTWLLVILFWPHLSCIAITGRQVKVLIKTAVYERPVNKLCLLVENERPSTGNVDTEN